MLTFMESDQTPDEGAQKNRFSQNQSYFDYSLIVRFFIWGLFALVLFLFLHFREVYVESFELGSTAKKYVVAQTDFVFPDEESTIILKQEASQEIKSIYRIDEDQIYKELTDFQNFLTKDAKALALRQKLIEEGKNVFNAINLLSRDLLESRFTDARTFERIRRINRDKLPGTVKDFYVFLPSYDRQEGKLPIAFWSTLKQNYLENEKIQWDEINLIISYFEDITWKFTIDESTAFLLRKAIFSEIPEKLTYIRAGERILDQGEKVTTRHLSMLKAMRERMEERSHKFNLQAILGSFLLTLLFLGIFYYYLLKKQPDLFFSNRKLSLIIAILILNLVLAKFVEIFLVQSPNQLIDIVRFPLFVPFSAILLASLLSVNIAAFAAFFLTIVFSLALAVESLPFVIINIITASIAILSIRHIRRRKEVFVVGGKAWLGSLIVIISFNLYEGTLFSLPFLSDVISTFLFMLATCILIVGVLPLLESSFHIITDITLMEFMDPNNELLRRLSIEAPGTYQHSMIVGSLAEAAASSIKANGLFCRIATLYHDIGKLTNVHYFTENQLGKLDMHQLLTPSESAKAIISHVSDGVALARKKGLPEPFIDIIKEHHGTTLVYYFYHKQLEVMGGDKTKVNKADFRYSGPKPCTKESTIIMIADTLEAASRSLDVFNEETISELVNSLVAQKTEDGQFNESPLTFEEMASVKKSLIHSLIASSHSRVKYPPHHPGEEG